jgi:hypothetical protein
LQTALNAIASVDASAVPPLLAALGDRSEARRAAAATALCQVPALPHRAAVRQLLDDPAPPVRLAVALALAETGDRSAVPKLIDLLPELPGESAALIDDYLGHLAADQAPDLPSGDEPEKRRQRRDAWRQWWQERGPRVPLRDRRDLPPTNRYLGHTLLIHLQTNEIVELGADGNERWRIGGLLGPLDAISVGHDRVLIAEHNAQRVSERTSKGKVVWQKQVGAAPVNVQRLPSGNTFIVCRNLLVEVDRQGREVFKHQRPANDIMSAARLRDGRIACVSARGTCFQLDADGKEVKSYSIVNVSGHANEVLPHGGVIAVVMWQHKVIEYGPDGRVLWEAAVVQPASAHRLPNGHTLVASQQQPHRLIELDRTGRTVRETNVDQPVHRARRH